MLATRGTAMLTTLRSARAQALNWLLPAAGAALTVLGRAWLQSSPPLRLALEPCALAAPALPAEAAPADVGGSCDPSGSAWRRSWASNLQADTERAGPAPWAADILLMVRAPAPLPKLQTRLVHLPRGASEEIAVGLRLKPTAQGRANRGAARRCHAQPTPPPPAPPGLVASQNK